MNVALCPVPRQQFSDINGVPLAGGFCYTYAAGTTTPLATYIDGLGAAANTNPIVLDAGGFASIWLSSATYKIVVTDSNGVQQWVQDGISAVSQLELTGNSTFTSLTVTGSETVGGNETVAGTLTAATLAITGSAAVTGALTAASAAIAGAVNVGTTLNAVTAAISGNETVGGTLGVTGMATVGDLTVGATEISALITSLIPVVSAVSGALIITNVAQAGSWVIFTFGATPSTRIRIAFGAGGGIATGGTIPLPSGFTSSNLIAHASLDAVSATSGNQLSQFAVSVTAGTITVTAGDSSGHSFVPTAAWSAVAWQTGY